MRQIAFGLVIAACAGVAHGAGGTLIEQTVDFEVAPPSQFGAVLRGAVTTTATYRVPALSTAVPPGTMTTITMGGLALAAGSNYMPDPPNAPPQFIQLAAFSTSASVSGSLPVGTVSSASIGSSGDNYAGNASIARGSKTVPFDLSQLNPNGVGYIDFTVTNSAEFVAGTRTVNGHSVAAIALAKFGTFDIGLSGQSLVDSGAFASSSFSSLSSSLSSLPTLPSGLTYVPDDDGSPLVMYKSFDGAVADNLAPELLVGLPNSLVPEPTGVAIVGLASLALLGRRRR